jgi:sec-independent protein translocase protein TatB
MEIFGIGPAEFLFIVIIALIIMGPKDMEKAGRTLGSWLNRVVKSDTWQAMRDTSKEIRGLPTRLMRDANLEEMQKELNVTPLLPDLDDMPARKNAPEQYKLKSVAASSAPAPTGDVNPPAISQSRASGNSSAAGAPKKVKRKPAAKKPTASKSKVPAQNKKAATKKQPSKARRDSHA